MNVTMQLEDGVLIAKLSGELDHHSAPSIRTTIDIRAESAQPSLLILDFKDVSFMDSSGIGLVMGRYKMMKEIGGDVKVSNPSPQIRRVMCLAGLDRLAVIERTLRKEEKRHGTK